MFYVAQTEDSLEQERKIRSELEKTKRKLEADLRAATDNVGDLQKDKALLEESMRKYKKINYRLIFYLTNCR